jgi:hypothetical protein
MNAETPRCRGALLLLGFVPLRTASWERTTSPISWSRIELRSLPWPLSRQNACPVVSPGANRVAALPCRRVSRRRRDCALAEDQSASANPYRPTKNLSVEGWRRAMSLTPVRSRCRNPIRWTNGS